MPVKTPLLATGWCVLLVGCLTPVVHASENFPPSFAATVNRPDRGAMTHRAAMSDPDMGSHDAGYQELLAYRLQVRWDFNNRRFDDLERRAQLDRASKAKFSNGAWKLIHFYDALDPADNEPESTWDAHKAIHEEWVAAKPDSTTARTAQIDFLTSYAWHARGVELGYTVPSDGWRIFRERLAEAHRVFDETKDMPEKCPYWWTAVLDIALGEGWTHEEYDRVWADGKAHEPTFWTLDTKRSNFLARKWHGQPGEWEQAAETAAADGLGAEAYARCVWVQAVNYGDIFKQSGASWDQTKAGYELMRQRYPGSTDIASAYCRLACTAGDRPTAKKLFEELGDGVFANFWKDANQLNHDRTWAKGAK